MKAFWSHQGHYDHLVTILDDQRMHQTTRSSLQELVYDSGDWQVIMGFVSYFCTLFK